MLSAARGGAGGRADFDRVTGVFHEKLGLRPEEVFFDIQKREDVT